MNKRITHNNFLTVRDKKKYLKQNVLRIMQRTYSEIFSLISFFGVKGLSVNRYSALISFVNITSEKYICLKSLSVSTFTVISSAVDFKVEPF
jgi:hypothetical protein